MIKITDVQLLFFPALNEFTTLLDLSSINSLKLLLYDFWKRCTLAIRGSCLEINAFITKNKEL